VSADYKELTRSFEAQKIDPAAFRHMDHVGVAYEMLQKYDFLHATIEYARNIRMLATAAGVPEKFNTTITLAFMSLIAERMRTTPHTNYDQFLSENADLLNRDVLGRWYSAKRLESETARQVFLMPDIAVET